MNATVIDTAAERAAPAPAGQTAMPPAPLLEMRGVSKRFVKSLDVAAKIANVFGAKQRTEVVHAVDKVDLAIIARVSGPDTSPWKAKPRCRSSAATGAPT